MEFVDAIYDTRQQKRVDMFVSYSVLVVFVSLSSSSLYSFGLYTNLTAFFTITRITIVGMLATILTVESVLSLYICIYTQRETKRKLFGVRICRTSANHRLYS